MPRYYFDMNDKADGEGRDLPSIDEAHGVARRLLADNLARTDVHTGHYKSWSCLVRDGNDGKAVRVMLALLVEDMNASAGGTITFYPS